LARKMPKRNEGLSFSRTVLERSALHLGPTTAVAMFGAKAPEPLSRARAKQRADGL
jgi:hypothetical protein